MNEDIMLRAKSLQDDCKDFYNDLKKRNPSMTIEAANITWIYIKLAQIQYDQDLIKFKLSI